MLKNRLISLLIACAAVAVLYLGISLIPGPAMPEGTIREGLVYEATGIPPDATVLTVDGNAASADLYCFWLGSVCTQLDQILMQYTGSGLDLAGTLPGGQSVLDYVLDDAQQTVKQQLVVENLAERYGVSLTDEDRQSLDEQRRQFVEGLGGEEAYLRELDKLGLREETYDRIRSADYLYSGLYRLFCTPGSALAPTEDELSAFADAQGYITADHILIATSDLATGTPLSDEEAALKRALAEQLLEQLRTAEDPEALFAALADRYSEDTGRAHSPNGYTFNRDSGFVEEFTEAAYALGEGEISGIVESPFGYHILLRKALSTADAVVDLQGEYFSAQMQDALAQANLPAGDALERIDVAALYEALTAAQAG